VSGSYDNTVRIWDAITSTELQVMKGHSDYVHSVAFSPDGTQIVSASKMGSGTNTLCLWDTASGGLLDTKEDLCDAPSMVASLTLMQSSFSNFGSQLLTVSNPAVHMFIVKDGWLHCSAHNRRFCWLPVDCRPAYQHCLLVSPDLHRLAIATSNGRVVIFDLTGIDSYCSPLTSITT